MNVWNVYLHGKMNFYKISTYFKKTIARMLFDHFFQDSNPKKTTTECEKLSIQIDHCPFNFTKPQKPKSDFNNFFQFLAPSNQPLFTNFKHKQKTFLKTNEITILQ